MRGFCDGLLCFILKMVNFSLTQWLDPSGIGHAASSPRRSFAVPPWRRCARGRPGCLLDVWAKRRPSCHATLSNEDCGTKQKKNAHTHVHIYIYIIYVYMYIYIYIHMYIYIYHGNMVINKWFITYNWGLKGLKWISWCMRWDYNSVKLPWIFVPINSGSAPSCGWADISPLSDGGITYIQLMTFSAVYPMWSNMTAHDRWL